MCVLSELENYAREHFVPIVPKATRELLVNLIREAQPRKILEIGTAIGYSGIAMLSASPDSQLFTIEKNEDYAEMARKNFSRASLSSRANIFVGDATEIIPQITGKFDFVFMDGPKAHYGEFLPYITNLLAVGGTLVCDDVLYLGYVEHVPEDKRHKHITIARNMRAFLDDLMQNSRYKTALFRIDDGVTVSLKLR